MMNVVNISSLPAKPETTIFDEDHTQQLDWIIPVAITIASITVGVWFLVSLIHYGIKTGKWHRNHRGSSDKLNAGMVYTSVVVSSALCIFYFVINLIYIVRGFNLDEDAFCEVFGDATSSSYALILLAGQTFLWLRQRTFFTNRMLNVKYSQRVKFVSGISIIIIYASGISVLIFNVYPNDYKASLDGCLYMPNNELRVGYWISIVVVVLCGQATLLGLLVYALTQTRSTQRKSFAGLLKEFCFCQQPDDSPVSPISNFSLGSKSSFNGKVFFVSYPVSPTLPVRNSQAAIIRLILRKTLILAILSILTDVFILLFIHYVIDPNSHRRFPVVVGDIGGLFNLFLLIFSFVQFREMLISPCVKHENS